MFSEAFFLSCNIPQNGRVDKAELVDALKGMFPVEPGALEEAIEMKWRSWDADKDGSLGTVLILRQIVNIRIRSFRPKREARDVSGTHSRRDVPGMSTTVVVFHYEYAL